MLENNTVISTIAVQHSFSNTTHLHFKDWQVQPNEQWLLLGASGSGKSTLLHHVTGLLPPKSGRILLNGIDIYSLSERKLDRFRGRNIGIVFQRPHLIKSLTVGQNLLLAQTMAALPLDRNRINDVLETLDIGNRYKSYPNELSQGQLQRVSIARAVLNSPKLLVADEPTSSLDDKNAENVVTLLIEQSIMNKTTLIVSTHDQRIKHFFAKFYQL